MTSSDIERLRQQTIANVGSESSVTVNQRALIDKVLARYSSENTLLRELLQNADDANATHVNITYETADLNQVFEDGKAVANAGCAKVIVQNNGQTFRDEDWQRLKRIAEGNPDEGKIGAFGVGFYSVFSVCEEPFVRSGKQGMAFNWKNDQLYVRQAQFDDFDPWTTFYLTFRESLTLPSLPDLTKFLTANTIFTRSLSHIELHCNKLCLYKIVKQSGPSNTIVFDSKLSTKSPNSVFKLNSVSESPLKVNVEYLNLVQIDNKRQESFTSRFLGSLIGGGNSDPAIKQPFGLNSALSFFRVFSATCASKVSSSFKSELVRATKKPPPGTTTINLLFSSDSEINLSHSNDKIFKEIVSFPNQGKIYIGFPTQQTTSFSAHIGAPALIPTVERENIDLVNGFIQIWNRELLYQCGVLARIVYEQEIKKAMNGKDLKWARSDEAYQTISHVLKFFTFREATPLAISDSLESGFFNCYRKGAVTLLSDHGLHPSTEIRIGTEKLDFLATTPKIAPAKFELAKDYYSKLKSYGLLSPLGYGDILNELTSRSMSVSETIQFLEWAVSKDNQTYQTPDIKELVNVAVVDLPSTGPLGLNRCSYYLNPKTIPSDSPLPTSCLPFEISKSITGLEAIGFKPLDVLSWADFICHAPASTPSTNITKDTVFAARFLSICSNQFESMKKAHREKLVNLLYNQVCVPTKTYGIKKPWETYLSTIQIFPDLPVVAPMNSVKELFLTSIGVRKVVDLNLVLERVRTGGSWSHVDLIRYLSKHQNDISQKEISQIKASKIAPVIGKDGLNRIGDVYENTHQLASLGLPILSWPTETLDPGSDEAKFLYRMGLRTHPPLPILLEKAASADGNIRENAFDYLCKNFYVKEYLDEYKALYKNNKVPAFLPAENGKLYKPQDLFASRGAALFGFPICLGKLEACVQMFGIKECPDAAKLAKALIFNTPRDFKLAKAQFAFFGNAHPALPQDLRDVLKQSPVVPVFDENGKFTRHVRPDQCSFSADMSRSLRILFPVVDFGNAANEFLSSLGTLSRPSPVQLASVMISNPNEVWKLCDGLNEYLALLRTIAFNFEPYFKGNASLIKAMTESDFLVGINTGKAAHKTNHSVSPSSSSLNEEDEAADEYSETFVLTQSQRICIADDDVTYDMFKDSITRAPDDEYLEKFYTALGSPLLSKTAQISHRLGDSLDAQDTGPIKNHITHRLLLFAYESKRLSIESAKKMDSNIQVKMISTIAQVRESHPHGKPLHATRNVTAYASADNNGITLYLTKHYEYFDIAEQLGYIIPGRFQKTDIIVLEAFLAKDLRTLQRQGYNVGRFLNRFKAQNEQYTKLEKQSQNGDSTTPESQSRPQKSAKVSMSSEQRQNTQATTQGALVNPPRPQEPSRPSSAMGSITRFFNNRNGSSRHLLNTQSQNVKGSISHSPGSAMSQQSLDSIIKNAVELAQPATANSVRNDPAGPRTGTDATKDERISKEDYCDAAASQDLKYIQSTKNGIRLYASEYFAGSADDLKHNIGQAERFSDEIAVIASCYSLKVNTLSIFYKPGSKTIAFNRANSIYCNLGYYDPSSKFDSLSYWFITVAHELAHNIVSEHGASHSFYTESIAIQYFKNLITATAGTI